MIIQAFLRWADTAKSNDRARAANALGRAWLQSDMDQREREAALMAMTWLLDDPSPKVRLALADAIADSDEAPRSLILPLAGDQPEIACQVIARSPVLADTDLVDLVARGDQVTRVLIASRMIVSLAVSAAIAEVGEPLEIATLLDNPGALVGRQSLRRIATRFASDADIRQKLDEREELPADARHILTVHVSDALLDSPLVQAAIAPRRRAEIGRDASDVATLVLAGDGTSEDIPALIDHLRRAGRLTPGLLMQALCGGRIEFFAAAIGELSGIADRRVRSILADGRFNAIRALLESAGLKREISEIFVEAVLISRQNGRMADDATSTGIAGRLIRRFTSARLASQAAEDLIDMVEKLEIAQSRMSARAYASFLAVSAA